MEVSQPCISGEAETIAELKREMPNVEAKGSAVSYVYVHVIRSLKDNWCAVRVVVQRQNADGTRKNEGPRVLQDISEKITEMAADYNKAHPLEK
jgi:hypothetical protein